MRLFVPEEFSLGTILELVVRFCGYSKALDAVAEVIWCKKSEEKTNYYEMGLKFIDIDFSKFTEFLLDCAAKEKKE